MAADVNKVIENIKLCNNKGNYVTNASLRNLTKVKFTRILFMEVNNIVIDCEYLVS